MTEVPKVAPRVQRGAVTIQVTAKDHATAIALSIAIERMLERADFLVGGYGLPSDPEARARTIDRLRARFCGTGHVAAFARGDSEPIDEYDDVDDDYLVELFTKMGWDPDERIP